MSELITVQKIEDKVIQSGGHQGQKYRRVQIAGGRWCTVWDNGLQLSVGAAYRAELRSQEHNGETRWQIDGAVIAVGAPSPNGTIPSPSPEGGRERRIQAECAGKIAAELVRCLPFTTTDVPTVQIAWEMFANSILAWLLANDGQTRAMDEPF